MDDLRSAVRAVAASLIVHIRRNDDTKYGPIATRATEFKQLVVESEYEDVRVGDLPSSQYAAIKQIDGIIYLVFDTDNIPKEVLIEHRDVFTDLHKDLDGFALENRGGMAKAIKSDDSIDSVFDRYETRIPRELLPVLEEALVLRATERKQNLSLGTVYDWRGEIADKHRSRGNDPQDAQHLISLCSTGYFDENDVFDQMHTDLVKNGIKKEREYKNIIGMYIKQNPFAVFVRSSGMTAEDICTLVINKADKIERYPWSPGFIDICGKGKGTHHTIDQVKNKLENEYDAEVTEHRNQEIEQYILRISPDTL